MNITEWRPINKGTLLGFATVEMPSGMVIHDVGINRNGDGTWASPPGKPQLDRDKQLIFKNGKLQYAKVVGFTSKDRRDRWSDAIIAELTALGHI
ncbi:MAG: hypothetical protein GVY33_02040 [Alphaproteobacteria bacterium]|jgi:hypothetical protein|nr:hypothetical protein [Alphaproteobacteria bacterium]